MVCACRGRCEQWLRPKSLAIIFFGRGGEEGGGVRGRNVRNIILRFQLTVTRKRRLLIYLFLYRWFIFFDGRGVYCSQSCGPLPAADDGTVYLPASKTPHGTGEGRRNKKRD